jgi:hypothetical protein
MIGEIRHKVDSYLNLEKWIILLCFECALLNSLFLNTLPECTLCGTNLEGNFIVIYALLLESEDLIFLTLKIYYRATSRHEGWICK